MAIKAIINNTEKEIEQIKNSDEQDIDYVYSRIGDTEVEGELPISIKSIGGNLADYRICGNTVDGENVGDKTANLFENKPDNIINAYISSTIIYGVGDIYATIVIPCKPNTTYTVSKIRSMRFAVCYITGEVSDGKEVRGRIQNNSAEHITITTDDTANYLLAWMFNAQYDTSTKEEVLATVQVEESATATTYEPYGYRVPVTVEGKNLINTLMPGISTITINDGVITYSGEGTSAQVCYLNNVEPGTYTISFDAYADIEGSYLRFDGYPDSIYTGYQYDKVWLISNIPARYTARYEILEGTEQIRLYRTDWDIGRNGKIVVSNIQFEKGSESTSYEPYQTPVTTNLYLPEQIKMVGDEAEYIDYAEQKQHFADGTSTDVLLPALPTISGTNTLSIGTEVQPSRVYLKGKIKEIN